MRTIYLRRKASGNYEIVTGKPNQKEHTHKFRTWKALEGFYWDLYGRKVIKAEYRLSNTCFQSFAELKNFIKQQGYDSKRIN